MVFVFMFILLTVYVLYMKIILSNRRESVKKDWLQIDMLLKKRNDLIPSLIDITKDYFLEEETINNIRSARNNVLSSKSKKDKMKNSNKLTSELGHLFSITERFSDLKNNSEFIDIQSRLHDTEDQINNSRRRYNNKVLDYTHKLDMFPFKIVAKVFNYKPEDYFDEEEILEL